MVDIGLLQNTPSSHVNHLESNLQSPSGHQAHETPKNLSVITPYEDVTSGPITHSHEPQSLRPLRHKLWKKFHHKLTFSKPLMLLKMSNQLVLSRLSLPTIIISTWSRRLLLLMGKKLV
ncbi:unnamed protein product [Brassica napus]|uniref:(rape) hypothetical protein n=1 Tax=Brassica napus TaxID=3708 RepID=A0A816QDS9_BRANA|nr:unnamed protein product [Brassica napus]